MCVCVCVFVCVGERAVLNVRWGSVALQPSPKLVLMCTTTPTFSEWVDRELLRTPAMRIGAADNVPVDNELGLEPAETDSSVFAKMADLAGAADRLSAFETRLVGNKPILVGSHGINPFYVKVREAVVGSPMFLHELTDDVRDEIASVL